MTTRAEPESPPRRNPRRPADLAAALDEFGVEIEDRVCLARTAPPGEPSAIAAIVHCLLDRRARRIYVPPDTDGIAVRSDPRVRVAPSPAGAKRPKPWAEPPSVAVLDVRLGAIGETLPEVLIVLDGRGELVARTHLGSLLWRPRPYSAVYRAARWRVAITGAVRVAILRGWHVRAIAPVPAVTPESGDAFYMHVSWERRLGRGLDDMITHAVDVLSAAGR